MKLTNKEAADVIMRIQIQLGRRNGKMLLSSALLKAVEVLREAPEWIPITYRPMTVKERIEFAEYYGVEFCDTSDEKAFDCPMPEDGQKILISTSWGVVEDVAYNDIGPEGFSCYELEGNGDWDGVEAWMPLPKRYEKEGESDADS